MRRHVHRVDLDNTSELDHLNSGPVRIVRRIASLSDWPQDEMRGLLIETSRER